MTPNLLPSLPIALSKVMATRTMSAGRLGCAALTAKYGTTYFWGALLLPARQRRDVFAVYALCRLADDIVDLPDQPRRHVPAGGSPAERLTAFAEVFFATAYDGETTDDPVLTAVAESIQRRGIERDCFERFFGAMAMDVDTSHWADWPALRDGYMEGSAAVIGEMMLPVLEPTSPEAFTPARSLGLAFQLTNFLRDVGEDLDRGRTYLPDDELDQHGADPWLRRVTPEWRSFMAAQVARNRELYREAERGLPHLPPASARCVGSALVLYEQILDRIEAADYDVFSARQRVPTRSKIALIARVWAGQRRTPVDNRLQKRSGQEVAAHDTGARRE